MDPPEITLRTTYVPRYIRRLHLHYRANWPATLSLESTNPGEILAGWTLSQTNDGAGGQWASLSAPNPSLLADSIPFADFGNLLTFSFPDPIAISNAFSDSQWTTPFIPTPQERISTGSRFRDTNAFTTVYAVPPPHGTPIPWLIGYGFTNNFAAAELARPQRKWPCGVAGLFGRAESAGPQFHLWRSIRVVAKSASNRLQHRLGRTYRIDWAISPNGDWTVLRDGIAGTGGDVIFTDERNLSGVSAIYYRVVVEAP